MKNYELESSIIIEEKNFIANVYKHKLGFKVIHLKNDDPHLVSLIGFKTLPNDDMGVAHALEHCILSNSNFYYKGNTFNNLAKDTIYSYLNAMTYHDRTVYPFSSFDENEFKKIFDAYTDSIYEALLYEDFFLKEVLQKEYDGKEISYNGVLLNEMEDFFSNSLNFLTFEAYKRLFDNNYKYCNYGKPEEIKKIEFRDIINYYNENYNICESFILLYGNLDIKYYLKNIDYKYSYKAQYKNDNTIIKKSNFKVINSFLYDKYLIEKQYILSYNIKNSLLNKINYINLFIEFLFSNYIYDSNFSGKFKCYKYKLDTDMKQPVLLIFFNEINMNISIDTIKNIFEEDLSKILNSFDMDKFNLYLDFLEYELSVENFGYKPRGLYYGLEIFKEWVHNDELNFECLSSVNKIKELRSKIDIKTILNEVFLNNLEVSSFEVLPNNGEHIFKSDFLKKFKNINNVTVGEDVSFISIKNPNIIFIDIMIELSKFDNDISKILFYKYLLEVNIKKNINEVFKLDIDFVKNKLIFKFKSFKNNSFVINKLVKYYFNELIFNELEIINGINQYKENFKNIILDNFYLKFFILEGYTIDFFSKLNKDADITGILNEINNLHINSRCYYDFKINIGANKFDYDTKDIVDFFKSNISEYKNIHSHNDKLNKAVVIPQNTVANMYCINLDNHKFDYLNLKIISILINNNIFNKYLREENGVYDFGIYILENKICMYTKSDCNITETFDVFEKTFKKLLLLDNLEDEIEIAKIQLLAEQYKDFNVEWYFDKKSKSIFHNEPLINKESLHNLDIINYVKENLLKTEGVKCTFANKDLIDNNKNVFDKIIDMAEGGTRC